MCAVGTTWQGCQKCLDSAPSHLLSTACPDGRIGVVIYDDCILRYSDKPFINDETDRGWIHWTVGTVTFGDVIDERRELMNRIVAEAALSPLRFANGSQPYNERRNDT